MSLLAEASPVSFILTADRTGAKPFYSRMPGIDVFGLVSERIAHEVPRTRPRAGHNKWAPDALLLEHDPTFVFSCYELHRSPALPRLPCNLGWWKRQGYVPVTMRVPGLRERGEYYSFLVKEARRFTCPGVVAASARAPTPRGDGG